MEEFKRRAKKNAFDRKQRKRARETDAAQLREETTQRQLKEIMAALEGSDDPILWSTVDMTNEALTVLREHYQVTPYYLFGDEEFHSMWQIQ